MSIDYRVYKIYQVRSVVPQAPAYHLLAVLDQNHNLVGSFPSHAAAEEAIRQLLITETGPFTVMPAYLL